MPTYPQLWFPAGGAVGDDAKSGRGAFTKRHVVIQYAPSGDSEIPALTISHKPLDTSGLSVPAVKIEAGEYSQGDALLIEKFNETGAFLTGESGGDDIFSVEGDGDIWNLGTMYAHKANVGGIAAVDDGTTALDMTLGNLFTNTPEENTSWSTSDPTNGIGGELAAFLVDNAGGYTVAWAAGYTDVDSIEAADTGVHGRLIQFDGTTWHQLVATEDGVITNIPKVGMIVWTCNKPSELADNPFFIWHFHASRFPNGVTVTDCGIDTPSAASTYSVDFMRYDDPEDVAPDTIETVATSASYQAEDSGSIDNPDIAAGDMLAVSLPATDIDTLLVWVTFTID